MGRGDSVHAVEGQRGPQAVLRPGWIPAPLKPSDSAYITWCTLCTGPGQGGMQMCFRPGNPCGGGALKVWHKKERGADLQEVEWLSRAGIAGESEVC